MISNEIKWHDLEELSQRELDLVKNAYNDYGDVYNNSKEIVGILWNFIEGDVDQESWLFMLFLSQTRKSTTLSLLSIIRRHEVQGFLMVRHALEAAVFSCYTLSNPVVEEFMTKNIEGLVELNDKGKQSAFKWLEANYKTHSDLIRNWKTKFINNMFAHANALTSFNNFESTNSKYLHSYFDIQVTHITKAELWFIANVTLCLIDLFSVIIKKQGKIKLVNGIEEKINELGIDNERIKNVMKKDERFAKWL